MLNLFRKHATSWLIKVALFLIAIVFIFWGGYSYKSRHDLQVAKVGDHYITMAEYDRSYNQLTDMYRRQLGGSFSDEMAKALNLKQQALDMLIDNYVMANAAHKMGLSATTQEVQQKILEYPVFQSNGKFDQKRYVAILEENRLTPEMFEQQMADNITAQKLQNFIKRRAIVTDEDIKAQFSFNNTSIQLAYVLFEPKTFEEQVKADDTALKNFFNSHQDKYKDPEKRQISYVAFKTDDFLDKVKVTDDEIRQYYDENKEKYHKEAEVRARHILFSVKEDAPQAEVDKVKAEAQKVLDQAKKGADFAELAKKYSQDPGSANKGGDLGFFTKERMVPAFSKAAFSLKPGQISDLVRTQFGFHIIKVEETHPESTTPLDQVKNEIELTLKRDKARDIAYSKAREFADQAFAQKDLAKAAKSQNLALTGSDVWVSRTDKLPGLVSTPPDVMKKIFEMSDKDVSDILNISEGVMVAQLDAIKAPQLPAFDQVKDRVLADYKRDEARVLAQKSASELLEAAKKANSLEAAAKEKKMEIKTSDWFTRKQPDKSFRLTGEAQNSAFALDPSKPFPETPFETGQRFAVCQLLGKKLSEQDLAKERDAIAKQIADQKQSDLWRSWLSEERRKADVQQLKQL